MTSEQFERNFVFAVRPFTLPGMCNVHRIHICISHLAEVGLRVGLPRHMHNQFFVDIVFSDHSQGSDCVHCASVNHPHSITYSTSNPLCIEAGGHMYYLRQPQAPCVHCSGVPLTGLDDGQIDCRQIHSRINNN